MGKKFTDIKGLKKDAKEVLLVGGSKELKFFGFKVSPSQPTDDQLAKINRFTRREFKSEELYIGQLRLANNAIDRDNERFSEEVLQRFAATALRRTMLLDHDKTVRDSAAGKFFDVEIEKMSLQQAIQETGEPLKLPDGITDIWFHSPWFYIPKDAIDPREIVKIDAGIYDFASIGFRAEKLVPVMDTEGKPLFWEYRGSGDMTEMTEGSLVYLGAQYGMAVKSIEKEIPGEGTEAGNVPANSDKGGQSMKELLAKLKAKFGKTFSEEGLFDEMVAYIEEKIAAVTAAADTVKTALETKIGELDRKVKELSPLAEDGKAYRDGLVLSYVASKAKLGEASDKPEKQTAIKKMAEGFPIDFLKSEVAHLDKRVSEKFPAESQLGGTDDPEKRDKSKETGKVNLLKPKQK